MSKYLIGRELQSLTHRVEALEKALQSKQNKPPCKCHGNPASTGASPPTSGLDGSVTGPGGRPVPPAPASTPEEAPADVVKGCRYQVVFLSGENCSRINENDIICVAPCPESEQCPNIRKLEVVDVNGKVLCVLDVAPADALHCGECTENGRCFTWYKGSDRQIVSAGCWYTVTEVLGGQCGDIAVDHRICVSCCRIGHACPEVPQLSIVDGHGRVICELKVKSAEPGACASCADAKHHFKWHNEVEFQVTAE